MFCEDKKDNMVHNSKVTEAKIKFDRAIDPFKNALKAVDRVTSSTFNDLTTSASSIYDRSNGLNSRSSFEDALNLQYTSLTNLFIFRAAISSGVNRAITNESSKSADQRIHISATIIIKAYETLINEVIAQTRIQLQEITGESIINGGRIGGAEIAMNLYHSRQLFNEADITATIEAIYTANAAGVATYEFYDQLRQLTPHFHISLNRAGITETAPSANEFDTAFTGVVNNALDHEMTAQDVFRATVAVNTLAAPTPSMPTLRNVPSKAELRLSSILEEDDDDNIDIDTKLESILDSVDMEALTFRTPEVNPEAGAQTSSNESNHNITSYNNTIQSEVDIILDEALNEFFGEGVVGINFVGNMEANAS